MYKGALRQKDKKKVTKEKITQRTGQARQTKQRLMLASRGVPERKEAVFLLGRYGDVRDANEMRMGMARFSYENVKLLNC